MRMIDFHTHIFPDRIAQKAVTSLAESGHVTPFLDGREDSLSRRAREAGCVRSVVLPVVTRPAQHASILRFAMEVNLRTHKTGLCSFGGIHAAAEDPEEKLDEIARLGFRGIKLHPVFQGVAADDERTVRILRAACERDLIVTLHAGWDISFPGNDMASAERIARLIDRVLPKKLILAHMGGWGMWKEAERLLGTEGVYLDTSFCMKKGDTVRFLSPEAFARMVRLHGADRVLFGTDSPWSDQEDARALIEASPLTGEEKHRIFYDNASRLLGPELQG